MEEAQELYPEADVVRVTRERVEYALRVYERVYRGAPAAHPLHVYQTALAEAQKRLEAAEAAAAGLPPNTAPEGAGGRRC